MAAITNWEHWGRDKPKRLGDKVESLNDPVHVTGKPTQNTTGLLVTVPWNKTLTDGALRKGALKQNAGTSKF